MMSPISRHQIIVTLNTLTIVLTYIVVTFDTLSYGSLGDIVTVMSHSSLRGDQLHDIVHYADSSLGKGMVTCMHVMTLWISYGN